MTYRMEILITLKEIEEVMIRADDAKSKLGKMVDGEVNDE